MRSAAHILGLGNPLRGDDGIGPRVVEELTWRGLPEGVVALDVLALVKVLGRILPEMAIFGVQPMEVGCGEGLSLAVEAAPPALADAVLEEIGEYHAQDSGD